MQPHSQESEVREEKKTLDSRISSTWMRVTVIATTSEEAAASDVFLNLLQNFKLKPQ
jgi:hypothetical protein